MKKIIMLAFILVYSSAFASDFDVALNNAAHEMAVCTSYYLYIVNATEHDERDKKDELSKKYMDMAQGTLKYSVDMSNQATTEARVKIAMDEMVKQTEGNISNISRLFVDYAQLCKEASEKPFDRLRYWLNKK